MALCAHCGNPFQPSRSDHRFCSARCRHAGEPRPYETAPPDPELIGRLFDPGRDELERVDESDWHPGPSELEELDACDTLGRRREWYRRLVESGLVPGRR